MFGQLVPGAVLDQESTKLYWTEKLNGVQLQSAWNQPSGWISRIAGWRQPGHKKYWNDRIAPHLEPGETVYYEVVGFHHGSEKPLVSPGLFQNLKRDTTERLSRQYGLQMVYSYGCDPSTRPTRAFVYRITKDIGDGLRRDYTWDQIREVCATRLCMPTVPLLNVTDGTIDTIRYARELSRGESVLGGCIREGVCVRQEWCGTVRVFVHTSWLFKAMHESDSYVP